MGLLKLFFAVILGLLLSIERPYANTIALVNSYHADYLWSSQSRKGFEENVGFDQVITYYEMDAKRSTPSQVKAYAESILQQIVDSKPDLVVTMDDSALKHLGEPITLAGFPIVFMGVNQNPRDYFTTHQMPETVTGVLQHALLKPNITLLSRILPTKAQRILLLMDSGLTSHSLIDTSFKDKHQLSQSGMVLEYELIDDYLGWQQKVKSLTPDRYDAIIIASYANLKDGNNQQVSADTTVAWTSAHSAIPVFALLRFSVGKGKAIGGLLQSGYDHGFRAAKMANTVLATGVTPYFEVPKNGDYLFSEHELARWGLKLPEDIKRKAELLE